LRTENAGIVPAKVTIACHLAIASAYLRAPFVYPERINDAILD
jgi:hypothetical protein